LVVLLGVTFGEELPMKNRTITALVGRLGAHAALGKQRLATLALLVTGVIGARTVNLSHVASERGGSVLWASTYRRLQRFFQYVRLPQDWAAGLLAELCGPAGKWTLCLDRTNWAVGRTEINILVLALSTRRHRIPLMWTQLGTKGNSSTPARIALMERFLARFGHDRIEVLLADREFVSEDWLTYLTGNGIPFAIRLRHSLIARDARGHDIPLKHRFARRGTGKAQALTFFASARSPGLTLTVTARRLPATRRHGAELLIVATNRPEINALTAYRRRWAIESLFGDTKTRGLNLEDTHLTDPAKLDTLMAIVAIATAWASSTAATLTGTKPLPRKKHGYYAKSFFRTGFDHIRNLLRSQPPDPIPTWTMITKTDRVV
jgi:Transposase DDE domain